jgi:hypothetical protein
VSETLTHVYHPNYGFVHVVRLDGRPIGDRTLGNTTLCGIKIRWPNYAPGTKLPNYAWRQTRMGVTCANCDRRLRPLTKRLPLKGRTR